ncbi:hypothetical protein F5887DRAFT_38238 [Amanita rubescens]|nr:hypothetical protein F5887DRAFT_38238 [Amanita rubescens]
MDTEKVTTWLRQVWIQTRHPPRGLLPGDSNGEHIWGSTLQDDTPRIRWSRISQEITPYPAQGSNEPRTIHAEHSRSPLADQGNDSSEERLVYHVNGPRQQRSDTTSSNASNVDSNSSYAGGGVTSDSSFSSTSRSATYGTTHHRTSHRTHRRRTTVPGHETDVESVRRREDPRIPPTLRPSSVSVSSWSIHPPAATTAATIATASHTNTHHSQNASNALNLSSFGPASMYPTPPGDTPGSTLSSLGLHSFPLREDDEIVMERLPSTAQGSTTSLLTGAMQTRQRGERRVSFDQRPSIIGAGGSATSIQSLAQGQATTATSTVSALVMTTNANEPSRHAHRRSSGGRHAISHGYSHTGRSTTSARPAPGGGATYHPPMLDTSMAVEDAVHLAAAEMPRPLPRTPPRLRNALGLQLEDNAGRGISAPTPLVPAEGFLRSWSHEQ